MSWLSLSLDWPSPSLVLGVASGSALLSSGGHFSPGFMYDARTCRKYNNHEIKLKYHQSSEQHIHVCNSVVIYLTIFKTMYNMIIVT